MISIIVHSTNRSKELNKFLRSLTHQTEKDFEVVIVDNQSTDNTVEVISKYADKLRITHVVTQFADSQISNLNPLMYNLGVAEANSDKIILTVSDTIWEINNVKNALELFDENKVIYGRALQVENSALTKNIRKFDIDKHPELNEFTANQKAEAYFKVHEKYHKQPVFYIAVLSKKVYEKIGGMDERFMTMIASSDVDLGFRLACVVKEQFTDKLFVYHQKHKTKEIDKAKWDAGITLRNQNHARALKGEYKVNNPERTIVIDIKEY